MRKGMPAFTLDELILEHQSTALLLFDERMRLLRLNPAAELMLELNVSKVIGCEPGELLPLAADFDAVLRRVHESGQPLTEHEMRLSLEGERTITVDCTVVPVNDAEDRGYVLTELVQLDRHMAITRDESLMAQNETARALVRGLAHEIRNPLGGLRGAAQLLERQLVQGALTEYTDIIIRESDRLQRLLDRLLGPRTPPQKREMNIHEVTERVCALVSADTAPGVDLVRDYDPGIPPINADPELLIQAALNIARNAAQAVRSNGSIRIRTRVQRQFTIAQRRHKLVVRIEIVDDGPGVPEHLLKSLFYPLVTGRSDGTGLGLSIAQSLIYQHGGLVEYVRDGGLTKFSILLPLDDKV